MNCSRFETLLNEYIDGELDKLVRAAIDGHLDQCTSCSTLLHEVTQLKEELAFFPEISVSEEFISKVLTQTSGIPEKNSLWKHLISPSIQPFFTQRYAFATVLMFVFISFAVNVMGPGFSASSYSRLSPASIVAKADQVTSEIYRRWREFNDLKTRIGEEVKLLKEDLFGRLDYHLVTVLFRSYSESIGDSELAAEENAEEEKEDEQ
jgi:hypothetical protein